MSRYWYGLAGLALLAVMIFGSADYICDLSQQMETLVDQAEQELETGNKDEAKFFLLTGQKLWEKERNRLETLLDHGAIEQVSGALSEAVAFLKYGKNAHCAAACHRLLQSLRALRDGQKPHLSNLF